MTPPPTAIERVNILGVGVSVLNLESALERIELALAQKQKGYICVTDVNGVMEAQRDPQFRRILNQSFLTTPDGMPTVWVGKLRGHRQMNRVYGPELMMWVCAATQNKPVRHFLYGGTEGVAPELQKRLEQKFPGLRICGTFTPPFCPLNASEEAHLIQQVNAAKPDILWVGLSTPKQERFMAHYLNQLDSTLMFGVGAAFDFHSGRVRQAPRWIQRSGFEWLFRLSCEPRRLWRRYLNNNPRFAFRILCQLTGLRKYALD